MLGFRLPSSYEDDDTALSRVHDAIAAATNARNHAGNRAANQVVIDALGVLVRPERDEAYCQEALDYHLGLLYAFIGSSERAAQHIERSGTHPGGGGNLLFPDHQQQSLEFRRRQEEAKHRGVPSIIIASMPRSGSASLTQTLSSVLDAPIMRASAGPFPHYILIPRWLWSAASGGAILHDHFEASPFNLGLLRDMRNFEAVFIRVRDPRAAVCSSVALEELTIGNPGGAAFEERVLRSYTSSFIPWLEGWLAAADAANPFEIVWLRQPTDDAGIASAARTILERFGDLCREAQQQLDLSGHSRVRANIVTGRKDAWRESLSQTTQRRLWATTPDSVRNLLALDP